jgi:hypothetical protein
MRIFSPLNMGVTLDITKLPALSIIFQLYAAKLTLATSTGVPLARWGDGLTILLEKVFGNIYAGNLPT